MYDSEQIHNDIMCNTCNDFCIIQAIVDERNRTLFKKVVESASLAMYYERHALKLCERFN